ncbi:HEAT repeat domain-containing protein, partial [Spirillospora sp. NPDC049652]
VGAEGVEALLLAAESDRDGRVRRTATALLDALVRSATELYAQGLQEDEPHIRVQAVLGLVTLRAADEVAEAADDPAREVRVAVAEGLARLADEPAHRSGGPAAEPARGPAHRDPAPYALDHLLADRDPVVRMAAIDAVAELGAPEPLVGRVVTATAHASWQVRRRAAMALAFADPEVAIQPLVRALRDRIVDVRRAAVQSLEQWAPANPEVLTALTEALADSDPGVRTQARWALSK